MKVTNKKNLDFIRNEQKRSNIMTKAGIQPFCRTNNNLGYFDGTRVFPRSVTDRDNALFLYSIHFCLIWKYEMVSFIQAIKELKNEFKLVDTFITEEIVNSQFIYEIIPKNFVSHLTKIIVCDLETHDTDRARPYCSSFYQLSKVAGRYNRNLSTYRIEKCKKDTFAFDGDSCISKVL